MNERKPLIGDAVVYLQADDESPLGFRVGAGSREHPAQIAYVYPDGRVDLCVFPFGYYQYVYQQTVSRGKPPSAERCWYYPEDAA